MLKRTFDVAVALVGLVALLPVLAAVAAVVKLGSPGPALFRQVRVGRGGRDFVLYKFRTMAGRPGSGRGSFDAGDASRVTRVGRLLRATKLDELPQLWNVVRGEMSLVGPRPEVRRWVDAYPGRWAVAHAVRPGITDRASVAFRHEEDLLARVADPAAAYRDVVLPRKLDLYEEYARTRTFVGDLAILGATARAIVARRPTIHAD